MKVSTHLITGFNSFQTAVTYRFSLRRHKVFRVIVLHNQLAIMQELFD